MVKIKIGKNILEITTNRIIRFEIVSTSYFYENRCVYNFNLRFLVRQVNAEIASVS